MQKWLFLDMISTSVFDNDFRETEDETEIIQKRIRTNDLY